MKMFKKLLEFLKKLGFGKSYSASWKGKGTSDITTAEYGKHEKKEEKKEDGQKGW